MITIQYGDCVNLMAEMQANTVSTIFADPPYNTKNKTDKTVKYDRNKDFAAKNWQNFHADWDTIDRYYAWSLRWMRQAYRVLIDGGSMWVCGSFHNIPECAIALKKAGFYTVQWVAWCIPNAFPHLAGQKMGNANQVLIWARKGKRQYYDYERAKTYTSNGTNLRDFWIINNDAQAGRKWKHPSKKPVALVTRALDISTPKGIGSLVLDPFGGSGTTGDAAQKLGLDCLMMDNKPEYIDMMHQRIAA